MTRRPGLTLTEALVALFVAALGMISLLVLFPLGAVQMGQALKDERTMQTALKGDGLLRVYWQTQVSDLQERDPTTDQDRVPGAPFIPPVPAINFRGTPLGADPLVLALNDPNDYLRPGLTIGFSAGSPPTPVTNPQTALFPLTPRSAALHPAIGGGGPSYPVLIDPLGWAARPYGSRPNDQGWLAGVTPTGVNDVTRTYIPRRTLKLLAGGTASASYLADANVVKLQATSVPGLPLANRVQLRLRIGQNILSMDGSDHTFNPATQPVFDLLNPNAIESARFVTLQDDLTYDDGGSPALPDPVTGAVKVERLGRYSWAAIVQRPNNNVSNVINLTILVFESRAPGYAPFGLEQQLPRDTGANAARRDIVMIPGQTSFRVYYDGEPPAISKGRWVMDGTIDPAATTAVFTPTGFVPGSTAIRNANFYRVSSVTPDEDPNLGNAPFLRVELDRPIRGPLGVDLGSLAAPIRNPLTGALDASWAGQWLTEINKSPPATLAGNAVVKGGYVGQIYLLNALSEVYERPPITTALPVRP